MDLVSGPHPVSMKRMNHIANIRKFILSMARITNVCDLVTALHLSHLQGTSEVLINVIFTNRRTGAGSVVMSSWRIV